VSAITGNEAAAQAAHGAEQRPNAWWGMLLVVFTEATLFALLLLSYFYLRAKTPGAWPTDEIQDPLLLKPALMTVLLVASDIPMVIADRRIRRDDRSGLAIGLAITFLMGLGFLALQVSEYRTDIKEFSPQTDAYGSLFYTVNGIHALHVVAGLLLIAWTFSRALEGHVTRRHKVTVQVTSLYWHFVHIAWLAIFAALYLSPHL
jgi:heme/copper-type cytochrome/quinol oxidase subunit 3